ncbi:MAG: response regulator [Lachnospiraceae bacterium]|nr:response regulator [Lachnospiraceae bacterium]
MARLKSFLDKYGFSVLTALLFMLIVGSFFIISPLYSDEERELAVGETFNLDSDWEIEYADGSIEKDKKIPFVIPAEKSKGRVYIRHDLRANYEKLAMTFYSENSAMHAIVGGKPVFSAGFGGNSLLAPSPKNGDDKEGPSGIDGPPEGPPPSIQESDIEDRYAAGSVIFDMPENISEGDLIEIELETVDSAKEIPVHLAVISKRDVAVTTIMRRSFLPLTLSIFIIISCIVMVILDVLRAISKKRTRGLYIISLLGIVVISCMLSDTKLFTVFWGNRVFFDAIGLISLMIMPPFIAVFFRRGFFIHFPWLVSGLSFGACVLTALSLVLLHNKVFTNLRAYDFTLVLSVVLLTTLITMLIVWSRHRGGVKSVWMDLAALFFFLCAIVLEIIFQIRIESYPMLETLKNVLFTFFFFFMTGQHVQIMMNDYNYTVQMRAYELEAQVQMAESARQDAIIANEAKGRFLANMSHEIRTPINAVLGMDEMILRESNEKAIKGYATDIRHAGQTLLSLINDILDFSKIESGKLEIIPVTYDFSNMINDLVNMVSTRARAKDLKIETDIAEDLPLKLYGDDVRIRQVLTNILTNAVKYTHEGGVTITIKGTRLDDGYEELYFEVKDTGIGIKEEDLPKLFKEFERIEEGRNRNIEGTGLGMNITIDLLHLMGSKMEVESVYGEGSKFFFTLRQKIVDETPIGNLESRIENREDEFSYSESFIAPEAKVLVVDDNSMNRKVFISLLKATRIQIDDAPGGAEAIECAKKNQYDMIFMDHMMPEMDGIEAMKRIHALAEEDPEFLNKDTPIFVLTANAVAGAKEQYISEGFNGFLSKPVIAERLEAALRENLPKDKILPAPENEGLEDVASEKGRSKDDEAALAALPQVDGLDWDIGYMHLPDMILLEEAVKDFYSLIKLHADKLDKMYEDFPSDFSGMEEEAIHESLSPYRIQVHGMKSTAATIGIFPLSGMAKVLEFAARDHIIERIRAMHGIFIAEWRSYRDKLQGVFGLGEDEGGEDLIEKEAFDKGVFLALLEMLKSAMEDMDVDQADELMGKIRAIDVPQNVAEKKEDLAAAVADLDSDSVSEIADGMAGEV